MADEVIKYYEIESYGYFAKVDKSILALNQWLAKWNYRFVCFTLEEVERLFSEIIYVPKSIGSLERIYLENIN